jgi:SAM-dependent methyltransferase
VRKLLLAGLPPGARILDLCCGTGQLLRALQDEGFVVTGLDGSAEQLACAREHVPGASLVHADARAFALPRAFDAVISLSDSLNHMLDREQLTAVFRCVRRTLSEGGCFLFDMNMEPKYLGAWAGSFSFVDDDLVTIVRTSVEASSRHAAFDATIFVPGEANGWARHDVSLPQTWFSQEEVDDALRAAGFAETVVHYPSGPGRAYFVAR